MKNFNLSRNNTGLLIIDVQDKLFNLVDRSWDVLYTIQKVIKGCQILGIPIVVSEQYPKGLGETIEGLKHTLGDQAQFFSKTTFSCFGDENIKQKLLSMPVSQWLLVGIEAHVCVLQTAKDLLAAGKDVAVLNDAISSRSIYDFSTAIAELRDIGARVSSAETVLFELVRDSRAPEFKQISDLIK